ncbi:MAG TPA: glucose 1-dehydrogenase [Acidimicrobiales bacterium]|nr:glucose 1-dehydrogenase [Acidimicrobiales bacterium]
MAVPDVSGHSLPELWSLAGRRAVITGGAKGIGRAIAERFAEAGASIVLGDLDADAAQEAASAIATLYGVAAHAVAVEMADSASVAALADASIGVLGGIDIWVNNAGIYPSTPFLEIDHAEWDRVIAVNVRGYFVGAQHAARHMVTAGKGGVIINISSTGAVKAAPGVAHYITSKHGVVGITKALSVELAPHDIRVLSIAPSMTQTEGRVAFLDRYTTPEIRELIREMEGRVPLGRIGVPDDVARAALFAASDMSILMSGSILFVDSGESAL